MHNKLLIADNRAVILGGRNIGNEYFGLSPEFGFRDFDALGFGPVARQASQTFDRFWNSERVLPASHLDEARTAADLAQAMIVICNWRAEHRTPSLFATHAQGWRGSTCARVEVEPPR